jgi:hypothetical protein
MLRPMEGTVGGVREVGGEGGGQGREGVCNGLKALLLAACTVLGMPLLQVLITMHALMLLLLMLLLSLLLLPSLLLSLSL